MDRKVFVVGKDLMGTGTIHKWFYDQETEKWYIPCRGLGKEPHGIPTDRALPVTCGNCLKVPWLYSRV